MPTDSAFLQDIKSEKPHIAQEVQKLYDAWVQDEEGMDPELGSGGICDQVADAIASIFSLKGYEVADGGWEGDEHAFTIVHNTKEAYAVDIPCSVYEEGGGYNWKKRPGVTIQPSDVVVYEVDVPEGDPVLRIAKRPEDIFTPAFIKTVNDAAIEAARHMGKVLKAQDAGTVREALKPEFHNRYSNTTLDTHITFLSYFNGKHFTGFATGVTEGRRELLMHPEQAELGYVPGFLHELKHVEDLAAGRDVTVTEGLSYSEGMKLASERRARRAEKMEIPDLPAMETKMTPYEKILRANIASWEAKIARGDTNEFMDDYPGFMARQVAELRDDLVKLLSLSPEELAKEEARLMQPEKSEKPEKKETKKDVYVKDEQNPARKETVTTDDNLQEVTVKGPRIELTLILPKTAAPGEKVTVRCRVKNMATSSLQIALTGHFYGKGFQVAERPHAQPGETFSLRSEPFDMPDSDAGAALDAFWWGEKWEKDVRVAGIIKKAAPADIGTKKESAFTTYDDAEEGGSTELSLAYFRKHKGDIGKVTKVHCAGPSSFVRVEGTSGMIVLHSCGCGYSGEGPRGTKSILEELGVDKEEASRLILQQQFDMYFDSGQKEDTIKSSKYPTHLTMEQYNRTWKRRGWKIIYIGPTATWRQEWGIWEAIREIVQNALDESEEYTFGYDAMGLYIQDHGKGVGVRDFLLGPPKLKENWARGKYGEGMKIGSLALVRAGYPVFVETTDRSMWIVFLEQDVGTGEPVSTLAALWKEAPDNTPGTTWHIVNYKGDSFADRFAVNLPKDAILAETPSTLNKPKMRMNQLIRHTYPDGIGKARVYARDIHMMNINSLFSYNLWGFDLAPDRHAPKEEYEMYADMGRVWSCIDNVNLLEHFIKMVSDPPIEESFESRRIKLGYLGGPAGSAETYDQIMLRNKAAWKAAWENVHGLDAVVRTTDRWDGLTKHLGYKSVSVSYDVRTALAEAIPTDVALCKDSQERLSEATIIKDEGLSPRQLLILKMCRKINNWAEYSAVGVFAAMIPPASDRTRTAGLYNTATREIFISLDQLEHGKDAFDTIIHELAHHEPFVLHKPYEDGETGHYDAMPRIAAKVVEQVSAGSFDTFIKDPNYLW